MLRQFSAPLPIRATRPGLHGIHAMNVRDFVAE